MSEMSSHPIGDDSLTQLVAYLDGELDADSSRRIEQQLAEDATFRLELQRLQQSWDLLDQLPRAEVDSSFTQTTVEMVALSAESDLEQTQQIQKHQNRRFWWYAAGSVLAASLAGYIGLSLWLEQPNKQLIRDLPIIEQIDLYRVADSVEFLRQLDREGLFDEEVDDAL